jgi:SAM-dependent methyltransferase
MKKISMKKFERIIRRLLESGISPEYSDPHFNLRLEWDQMPEGIDPASGFLNDSRAIRKRWQIENFIQIAQSLLKGDELVVDFGSGSGHLSLPLAYVFPNCHFILVERNPIPVGIGRKRIADSGFKNVEFFNGYIQDFHEKFDFGIAIHACGKATDLAQIRCLENNVPYILCPCDIGYIKNSELTYPRSSKLSKILTREEYNVLARTADWTCWEFESEQAKSGKLCMGYVSYDRNLSAEEAGYETHLFTTNPRESTPKNDIICGYPKGTKSIKVFERIRLYPSTFMKPDNYHYDLEKGVQKSIKRLADCLFINR